jgi:hypothetical protein
MRGIPKISAFAVISAVMFVVVNPFIHYLISVRISATKLPTSDFRSAFNDLAGWCCWHMQATVHSLLLIEALFD